MVSVWKTVRVYISSTFKDMQAERDHLIRFVFPRLRQELLKRRVHFIDVALRWGVTSEQDALEVCSEIINECNPRFLCMLGGRYGWTPPGKSRSITADEVYYATLDEFAEANAAMEAFIAERVERYIPVDGKPSLMTLSHFPRRTSLQTC